MARKPSGSHICQPFSFSCSKVAPLDIEGSGATGSPITRVPGLSTFVEGRFGWQANSSDVVWPIYSSVQAFGAASHELCVCVALSGTEISCPKRMTFCLTPDAVVCRLPDESPSMRGILSQPFALDSSVECLAMRFIGLRVLPAETRGERPLKLAGDPRDGNWLPARLPLQPPRCPVFSVLVCT